MSTFLTTGQLKQDIVEIAASSSTPLALTPLSPTIIHVTGVDTQLITLPNALKLEAGIHYVVINDSTDSVTVKDYAANTQELLVTGFAATFYLSDNTTSEGIWVKKSDRAQFSDKNIKIIGGGIWSWDLATETLTLSEDAYIIVQGLSKDANTILAGSYVIPVDEIAYVTLNKISSTTNLTVTSALPLAMPTDNNNYYVVAYRDSNAIVVGHSFRLIDSQSTELDQGISVENRTLLGSSVTPATSDPTWAVRGAPDRTIVENQGILDSIVSIDTEIDKFFGQLRLKPSTTAGVASITGTDRTMLTGEVLSQELGSRVLSFDGASIDFSTGVITTPSSSPLGLNFSPYSIPTGEYFWYCILVEYTGTTALGQSTARVRVGLASASNASASLAPFPQFPALFRSKPLGFIQVYNNAGTIEVSFVRQLGVGSGSGGGGSGSGLISVRAADFVTTALPTGASLTVDGVTIVNEDMILYGNAALNRVYKVTGIGSSLAFEEVGIFSNGNTAPQDGNQVAVADGNSNDVVWEWNEDTSTWSFISLSTENRQWLGLDVPTKTGGSFTTKVDPLGQINNVVVEDETLEKTLKRLDIRPDVLKRVRVLDLTSTSLPISNIVDGVTLVSRDKVLFGSSSLLGIYQAAVTSAPSITTATGHTSVPVALTAGRLVGQSFTTASSCSLTQVQFYLDSDFSSGVTLRAKVYATSGGTPTGSVLGISTDFTNNTIFSKTLITFTFTSPVILSGTTTYAIILEHVVPPSGGSAVAVYGTASSTYVGGDDVYSLDGGSSWFADSGDYYTIISFSSSLSWVQLNEFGGSLTPSSHDAVLVREGTEDNKTIWLYDSALTPPWHRVSGPSSTIWTGTTPYNTPSWDGTLSSADTTLKLALDTIDKYFRGLQLRRHSTDPKRVTILASATTKTDLTVLNFTVADRLLSFAGAEINFETGNVYASDGVTVISTFPPQAIPDGEFYWYAVGFDSATVGSDNTINPQITIDYSTGTGLTPTAAPKPSLTSRYTLGAVVVEGGTGGVGITPITQGSIIYLGQFTGFTDLEATVAQNTIDIAALQAYYASLPQQQKFVVGAGGQSVFNLTTFSVNASNTVFDVDYLIDGRWQTQSVTGDFLDGGAVKKNSTTQVQTAETVPEGKEFIVLKRTMSGGDPLVDLEGITVNLGFITPKTVGTLLRPASSLILQDKVTADIWELEVRNGVFQVVKIN
jgi:hypothetical protein